MTTRLYLSILLLLSSSLSFGMGKPQPNYLEFPKGFKWCVATSAHQIEGGNDQSDWWDWEQIPGKIKNGDRSGAAADHWNRLEQDTDLIKNLGVQTYRLSVEWAKIEPKQGEWNEQALAHYQKEIALLKQRGIEPLVTLHHFTLPRWVRALGGWEWAGSASAFERFTRKVYGALGADVRDWVTLNEPMVHLSAGYLGGVHPPGKKDLQSIREPLLGMLKAHARSYRALHQLASQAGRSVRVGIAHHLRIFDPNASWSLPDQYLAGKLDEIFNWAFAQAAETGKLTVSLPFTIDIDEQIPGLEHTQDFLGINYYSRDFVKFVLGASPPFELVTDANAPKNDMGWEIYPEGFYRILISAKDRFPGKSILITENGIADSQDQQRLGFIKSHLEAMHRAIQDGAPIETYCHWSLMDNFEWADGFGPRFGLYQVDYATQTRTLRPSGVAYSRIVRANGVFRE